MISRSDVWIFFRPVWYSYFKRCLYQRYRIFFFTAKFIFYTFLAKIDWMNEKAVFFFPVTEKKNSIEIEWMNEHMNFSRKKKQKKHPKMRKKKHNLLFNKIIETPPDFEWMANELFLGKKKQVVFFFPASRKKKNEFQDFEWMNGPWTFPRKKKYGTFDWT